MPLPFVTAEPEHIASLLSVDDALLASHPVLFGTTRESAASR